MSSDTEAVIVDTGIFSASFHQSSSEYADLHDSDVRDRRLIISFQTAAEIRYGAAKARWGRKRLEAMNHKLAVAVAVPPSDALVMEWARLRFQCQQIGTLPIFGLLPQRRCSISLL